jgi:tetratricopeptide (TPR) repeat protein
MISEPLIGQILEKLKSLSSTDFVDLVVEHLDHRSDYFEVEPGPPKGPDRKVDIFAMRRSPTDVPRRVVFQCKLYRKTNLDSQAVYQTVQAILYKDADEGVIVSTREPTIDAKETIEQFQRDGKVIDYKQWCGRGLVLNLVSVSPSVLVRRFPELRGRLPTAHEYSHLCPSFEIVVPTIEPINLKADRFYNGFPPTWENLAAAHDIERDVYTNEDGILKQVLRRLGDKAGVWTLALLGVGGTGKTTILRRLGFDVAEQGHLVLRLVDDWFATNASLSKQIKDVVRLADTPALVLLDNCADLVFERNLFQATFRELETTRPVVVVLGEQPDRWNSALRRISSLNRQGNYSVHTIHHLLPSECELLVDRILSYEQDGTLSETYCELSRQERLSLCQDIADRQLLVAMMQMRRGTQFRKIIQNEYERIPMAEAKEAYLLTCYFRAYNISLPIDLLLRSLRVRSPMSVQEFKESSEGLFIENSLGLSPRHSLIAYTVAQHGLIATEARKAALSLIVSNLTLDEETEQRIFLRLLTGPNVYRHIVRDLRRNVDSVRSLYGEIRTAHSSAGPHLVKFIETSQAMSERMLGYSDDSKAYLTRAIQHDPKYAFAYRQLAWLEHSEGNWEAAAEWAVKAAQLAPDNFLCNYHAGRILTFNTIDNFRKAKRYLQFALDSEPLDTGVQKAWDDYLAAEKMLSYVEDLRRDALIPEFVYKELRPGLSFLRATHGPQSREFKTRLVGKLKYMEQETRGDLTDLYEEIEGVNYNKDPILKALITCNIARLRYLDWFRQREPIDGPEIEKLFLLSLELNANDPFTHCWYGTFLKEVQKEFVRASSQYQEALAIGNRAKSPWMNDHPLFLNNIALLIMDEVQLGRRSKESLIDAQALLNKAVSRVHELESDFYWAQHSLALCNQLIGKVD